MKICDGTQREDDVVVLQRVRVSIESVCHDNTAFRQVDGLNFALKKSDMTQHLADRIDNVGKVKVACRDFV